MSDDLGLLVTSCRLPATSGVDAIEARLVTVQEVPPARELRFYALRDGMREHLTGTAASDLLRTYIPERPIHEMGEFELQVTVAALRDEVARMRPAYEAAQANAQRPGGIYATFCAMRAMLREMRICEACGRQWGPPYDIPCQCENDE